MKTFEGKGYEVIIASPSEYEELVAEVYFDGLFIAQLNKEKGDEAIELEIADCVVEQSMVCRKIELKGFLETIETARKRLIGECP